MYDDDLKFILSFGCFVSAIIIFALAIAMFFEYIDCNNYEEITGRETKFVFVGGCYVKSHGEWLTKKEHNAVLILNNKGE